MRTDWATRVVDNTLTHTNLIKFEGEQYSSEFDDFPLKFGSSQLSIAGGVIGVFGIVVKDPALAGIGTVLYMGSVAAYSIIKNLTHRKPQKPWEHDQYD